MRPPLTVASTALLTLLPVALACSTSNGQFDDAPDDTSVETSGTASTTTGELEGTDAGTVGSTSADTGSTTELTGDSGTAGSGTEDSGNPQNVDVWELRTDYEQQTPTETHYGCFSFNIPVDRLHHVIGFQPVVSDPVVHHFILSYSPTPLELDPNVPCFDWPAQILWFWAPGEQGMELPEDVGILVGDTGDTATFVLQVHYNNPLMQPFHNTDGIDVIVTDELRTHRAGVFAQGDIAEISIPPGEAAYTHTARCDADYTEYLLSEPIHVFASFLHAHEIGTAIHSELYRDGALVGTIAQQDPFDFDLQHFVPSDVTIESGDEIETRCTYDSTDRTTPTPGGVTSTEEMCINFMLYYPWIPAETCGSI